MDPTVSASLTVCLWCRLWVSLETNHIKSSLIYKLSQRQRGGQTNRESDREGGQRDRERSRQRGKQTQMTFTRLIIDSGETYLLPSLSRIYHNESVAVSGLPLMALTVSTKKSGAPAVVFVELIPIVCGTYIQMCVYPVSHSALWWLCQHCPFAARLYLMDAKKRS